MYHRERRPLVRFRVGDVTGAVPLEALHLAYSVRRSKIHWMSAENPVIIGLLERDGDFSTIADLGVLLLGNRIEAQPGSRLMEVRGREGTMILLADEVFEPENAGLDDLGPLEACPDRIRGRDFMDSVWARPSDQAIPILNVDKLITSLKDGIKHEL